MRWTNVLRTVTGAATVMGCLATIFPDIFVIRGTPPLGTLALSVAVGCGLIYLVILDRRLIDIERAERRRKLLAEFKPPVLNDPLSRFARQLVGPGSDHPAN